MHTITKFHNIVDQMTILKISTQSRTVITYEKVIMLLNSEKNNSQSRINYQSNIKGEYGHFQTCGVLTKGKARIYINHGELSSDSCKVERDRGRKEK